MDKLPFPVSFATEIPVEHRQLVLKSNLWTRWIARVLEQFHVASVRFHSVDVIRRKGVPAPLFIKLEAQATDLEGKRQHGIVLLRGGAVGVLVVLICEGERYLLLVDQPRFPLAERHSLEIVAGILDKSDDPVEIALDELREEGQIEARAEELIDLTGFWQADSTGFAASCGLLDETIRLYALEREVDRATLDAMNGKDQDYQEEGEWIRTVVLPYEQAARRFQDGKCFVALFLYERFLQEHRRSLYAPDSPHGHRADGGAARPSSR